jgi:hypothetical protein
MNWVFFPTAAVRRVHPTAARRIFQRDQEIQALPKDRCFLLQNCGNPYSDDNIIDGGEYDHNNGWGIQSYGFHTQVRNVFDHDNISGGMTLPGSADVRNSVFTGNNPDGQAAVIWAGSNSSFKDLTIKDNPSIGLFLPAGTSNVSVQNVLSTGNKPNMRNDMGLSVSLNGSGASLVPGQAISAAASTPAALPVPVNLRVISLP